ncbi:conjugal transfer protein TraG [Rhodobiaceae bacterium]|nr:conjugal transfer protein TraG [Rhodobiaceae bacterium]
MSKGAKSLLAALGIFIFAFLFSNIIPSFTKPLIQLSFVSCLGYGLYRVSKDKYTASMAARTDEPKVTNPTLLEAARAEGEKIKAAQQHSVTPENDDRAKRCSEILSLMDDEAAIAVFNAGAVMTDEEHKNFKKTVDRETSEPHKFQGIDAQALGNAAGHIIGREIGNFARNLSTGRYPNDVSFSSAVGSISESNRQFLRIGSILMKHEILEQEWLESALASVIFTSGNQSVHEIKNNAERWTIAFKVLLETLGNCLVNEDHLQQEMVSITAQIQREQPHSKVGQELAKLADGGAAWLNGADIPNSIYNPILGNGLFLGELEDGTRLNYDGEGSLFTIAPPGAGKSRCQVIPNLLVYDGPAIVLDIKGECYEDTAGHRSQRYGKVIRFAPHDKETSARYNPLEFVRSDPEHIASDARKMADMLIVSDGRTKDPYWQNKGRDFLTAYIAFIALLPESDPERTMQSVMDMMSPTEDMLTNAVDELRKTGIKYLGRIANQITTMPEKQRESAMDVAREQLSAWDLGDLDSVTTHCDWKPEDFRSSSSPTTLYLCVLPEDIDRFASVLRVIIGQHLEYFMKEIPEKAERPIVFFLDEVPQLGNFEPLPKAASLGRQYGLQLWLFAQNRDQIEKAYKSADTILGNAVVQCWMNCDEDSAAKLERNLGTSRGLLDGKTKPLVQSHELRGPEYDDKIIVVGRGQKPAKLTKRMVFDDPELSGLVGLDFNSGSGSAVVEEAIPSPSAVDEIPETAVEPDIGQPVETSQPR